jgi:hypothetical protein
MNNRETRIDLVLKMSSCHSFRKILTYSNTPTYVVVLLEMYIISKKPHYSPAPFPAIRQYILSPILFAFIFTSHTFVYIFNFCFPLIFPLSSFSVHSSPFSIFSHLNNTVTTDIPIISWQRACFPIHTPWGISLPRC